MESVTILIEANVPELWVFCVQICFVRVIIEISSFDGFCPMKVKKYLISYYIGYYAVF